eukprot:544279_1
MPDFSAALDVEKQTLFLCSKNNLIEVQLSDNHISNYSHNTSLPTASKSMIHNDSLFIIDGWNNHSIWKWNSENKTFTEFSDMYNKININSFAMICNKKHNSVLLFG